MTWRALSIISPFPAERGKKTASSSSSSDPDPARPPPSISRKPDKTRPKRFKDALLEDKRSRGIYRRATEVKGEGEEEEDPREAARQRKQMRR